MTLDATPGSSGWTGDHYLQAANAATVMVMDGHNPLTIAAAGWGRLAALVATDATDAELVAAARGWLDGSGVAAQPPVSLPARRVPIDDVRRRIRTADVRTVGDLLERAETSMAPRSMGQPRCTCRVQSRGTSMEVRILDRHCPVHHDPIPGGAL